jgi:DNA-binding transcriptional LysR family regulator
MIMNINEIEALVATLRTGGVTRAADQLHRSQPAVTRRIKLLEEKVGMQLIERVRGKVTATEAGRTFLPFAEMVLLAIKDGTAALRALHEPEAGVVKLALVGTLAGTTIVSHLRRFAKEHAKVRVELRTSHSENISELVRSGDVTLGIRYHGEPTSELAIDTVSSERMVVVCSAEHRLANRRIRDVATLAGERWVAFPVSRRRRDSFGHLLQRQLVRADLDGAEIVEIDSLTAQKRLVEAGMGLALVPESGIQEELRIGSLKLIHAPMINAEIPITVVYRRKGYLGGAALALLEIMRGKAVRPTLVSRSSK